MHRSCSLHVPTYSKWSYDIILRLKKHHDRQWPTLTRQKLTHCDIWVMVYDALQQRTGQMLWSHQYGHNQCPFNDKADALANQAVATHPLQLRPCILRRPGEPLAPSEFSNVLPKRNAEVVSGQQSFFGSTATKCTEKTEGGFGPRGVLQCHAQKKCSKSSNSSISAAANFGAAPSSANASR